MNKKFYNSIWFVWLALILFSPLGIFFMWKNKKFSGKTRIILTVVFSIWFILIAAGVKSNYDNYREAITQADKYFSDGNFSEAEKYYKKALSYNNVNSVKEKVTLCDKLAKSSEDYDKGITYFNDKDYLDAYNSFKLVIPEDTKRYDEAQSKASEASKIYTSNELDEANKYAAKADYSQALEHIDNILSIDEENPQAVKLKSDYQIAIDTQVEEKKKKEAEAEAKAQAEAEAKVQAEAEAKAQAEAEAKAQAELAAKQAADQSAAANSNENQSNSTSTNENNAPISNDNNRTVYWTPSGKSYHYSKGCSTLSRSKTILEGPLSSCPKSDPCDKCTR